jgi:hypothetical protein
MPAGNRRVRLPATSPHKCTPAAMTTDSPIRDSASGAGLSGFALIDPVATADYSHWGVNAIVVVATATVVCICALLHYEVLNALSRWLAHREGQRRQRVLFAIFGMLSVHVAEIWIFAIASAVLLWWPAFGSVTGIDSDILDQVYLSAMTFTTVGAADVHITGPIRFLHGMEALTGLVLITWSASFTFLEMERFWREH